MTTDGFVSRDLDPSESAALALDEADGLAPLRARFCHPRDANGDPLIYLCGNSLGLQPVATRELIEEELERWSRQAVDAHFEGDAPWFSYHELVREGSARLVGARPGEVVAMNGLTVNLHLMLVSFYRPTAKRHRILMEDSAFPSDTYALRSQVRFHGYDPDEAILIVRPREGEATIRAEDLERTLRAHGEEIALVMLGGVNYYTGQLFDLGGIARTARGLGCAVGFDLAHAAGNVPLALHDWDVDFAVWCTYKYLNSGPGAVAGCFVHERHADRDDLPRFAGWWGHDPARRFRMHLEPEFRPAAGADAWQLSNPSVLSMAPLRASLSLFDEAGFPALREKSVGLTGYLQAWVDRIGEDHLVCRTPRDPARRGCQLSLRALRRPRQLFGRLRECGVVGDFREPDVIRIAPVPLYNTFHEVWRFGKILEDWARD